MDILVQGVQNKQNVIITASQGHERSRFLLRSELTLLASSSGFKKIYHILDKERLIERVHCEATQMPFGEFGIKVSKYCDETPPAKVDGFELIICHLKHHDKIDSTDSLVVFDGITIENLEDAFYEPGLSWPVVLACNPPVDGIGAELRCKFDIVIQGVSRQSSLASPLVSESSTSSKDAAGHPLIFTTNLTLPRYKVFSSIVTRGPSNNHLQFGGLNFTPVDKSSLYSDSGSILESVSKQAQSGGVVVFFNSYGKMVEYHNAWQQSGVFERIGLPYGRENRGGDHFKNSLIKLARCEKSILLCSIRYHQDEDLAEFVMAQARAVIVVGLPYPFINDTWLKRIEYNNANQSDCPTNGSDSRLSGDNLYTYRAIEFLNGIAKRCLNDYRIRDFSFFVLDKAMEDKSKTMAPELGEVPVETFSAAIARHGNML